MQSWNSSATDFKLTQFHEHILILKLNNNYIATKLWTLTDL